MKTIQTNMALLYVNLQIDILIKSYGFGKKIKSL